MIFLTYKGEKSSALAKLGDAAVEQGETAGTGIQIQSAGAGDGVVASEQIEIAVGAVVPVVDEGRNAPDFRRIGGI